jgi:hypothetical protein
MVYVFVDTNLFLECKPVSELDWTKLFTEEPVTLMVATTVVRKLDSNKDNNSSSGKRNRALEAIKLIKSLGPSGTKEIKPGLTVKFLMKEPRAFEDFELDPSHNDDKILCSAFEFRAANPGESVAVFSDDTMIGLKGLMHNISVFQALPEWRMVGTSGPSSKPATVPSLVLGFQSGMAYDKIVLPAPPPQSTLHKQIMDKLKLNYQFVDRGFADFDDGPIDRVGAYNNELRKFF